MKHLKQDHMISPRTFLVLAYTATALPILAVVQQHWLRVEQVHVQQSFRKMQIPWPRIPAWPLSIASILNNLEPDPVLVAATLGQMARPELEVKASCGMRMTATKAPPTPTVCPDNDCRIGAAAFMRLPLGTPAEATPAPTPGKQRRRAEPAARPRLFLPKQTDL